MYTSVYFVTSVVFGVCGLRLLIFSFYCACMCIVCGLRLLIFSLYCTCMCIYIPCDCNKRLLIFKFIVYCPMYVYILCFL